MSELIKGLQFDSGLIIIFAIICIPLFFFFNGLWINLMKMLLPWLLWDMCAANLWDLI